MQIASIGSLSLQKCVDNKELRHNVEHVKEFGEEKREGQIEERLLLPTLLAEDEVAFEVGVDDVASVGANHVASMFLSIDTHFAQLVSAWKKMGKGSRWYCGRGWIKEKVGWDGEGSWRRGKGGRGEFRIQKAEQNI